MGRIRAHDYAMKDEPRKFRISREITVGNLITMTMVLMAVIGGYIRIDNRLIALEIRQGELQAKVAVGILPNAAVRLAAIDEKLTNMKQDLRRLEALLIKQTTPP